MIKINETFSIERDKYQWILCESLPPGKHPVTGEVGKSDGVNKTYHQTFEGAVIRCADKSCVGVETFEEMLSQYRAVVSDLERLAGELSDSMEKALDSEN